jgi:hypothetical protein
MIEGCQLLGVGHHFSWINFVVGSFTERNIPAPG